MTIKLSCDRILAKKCAVSLIDIPESIKQICTSVSHLKQDFGKCTYFVHSVLLYTNKLINNSDTFILKNTFDF